MGDLPKALSRLSHAIAVYSPSHHPFITPAQLEARRGSTKQAFELMRTAVGLSHCLPASLYVARAQIQWNYCNNMSAARDVLAKGCELNPQDGVILQTL